jgi:hypothetical protein
MKIICTKEKEIFVDDNYYDLLSKRNWYFKKWLSNIYAVTWINNKNVYLHHFILPQKKDFVIHHIDGNPLNNQLNNLKYVSKSINIHRMIDTHGETEYRGITYCNSGQRRKRWTAQITKDYKHIFIGNFLTKEEAALAYNKKAIEIYGDDAVLNDIKG